MLSTTRKIRVLTVDDSIFFQKVLKEKLSTYNPNIEIIAQAFHANDALKKLEQITPDVITLDVEMPGMSGIELIKVITSRKPIPIILVSSLNLSVFDALSNGAVDFIQKPDMSSPAMLDTVLQRLANKIVIGSHSKVRALTRTATQPILPTLQRSSMSYGNSHSRNHKIIAIGASTGGTEAILEVLKSLPTHIPGIVITQHMPAGFTKMYAERLNRICNIEVKEAQNGDMIRPGLALIAPGGLQMKVVKSLQGYSVSCYSGATVSGHCPSVDVLFSSMAEQVGANGIGIILTGMGRDGAQGMLQMHKAGAYTIGQDRASSVVYGMPMEAYNLGAVTTQVSCSQIATTLIQYLNKQS